MKREKQTQSMDRHSAQSVNKSSEASSMKLTTKSRVKLSVPKSSPRHVLPFFVWLLAHSPRRTAKVLFLQTKKIIIGLLDKLTSLPFYIRVGLTLMAGLMIVSLLIEYHNAKDNIDRYNLGNTASLLKEAVPIYGVKLTESADGEKFQYNPEYRPTTEVIGSMASPKFSAEFAKDPSDGVKINDAVNQVSFNIKPKFKLMAPKKEHNRLIYPFLNNSAKKVISLGGAVTKEDILLNSYIRDVMTFDYELELPETLEARLEADGSLGIYGPANKALLGQVATGSEDDAKLLEEARNNAEKNTLIFRLPKPYILESNKQLSKNATAKFELKDNKLTMVASGLKEANYPLTIDPSVYVETASKLMRGNNETNTDFDIDNELIQKSQTTGARIDAWQDNLDMSEGIWDHSTAAAGGYIYRSGGRTGVAKPQIAAQQVTTDSASNTSFTMDMPSERPAGDLYIALMCHDNAAATVSAPAGWTEYADTSEFAAYYKIGTDQGGGNESSDYTWTISASEAKAGVIVRVTNFSTADPISGSPGTGSGSGVPSLPATTPDSGGSLIIRAAGADNDTPSDTGWVPSGHTKIASANSGGQSCGFAAATLDSSPASGVSTGTASFNDSSINDTYGAASIAINPAGSTQTAPQVEDTQTSQQSSNSTSFTMNMPSSRPAGDLYIALMCHDGTITVTPPAGGGWTEYADTREHAAYYKIGTDQGGGNEASSYTWTGSGSEIWAGVIVRISNFDSSDPISGTPGTGSNGGNAVPIFPAVTPDENNSLVIRAAGADNDTPSATGWVPSGHSKIESGTPNVTNDCGYVSAFLDNAPASGVSTGTTTLGDSSLNDTYGASSIAINPIPASGGSSESVRATLDWARFNSNSLAIESPNPGTGACSGWCNDPTYNMPAGRRGHSMVAYNGYLYVIGGVNSSGTRESSIYIAKLGANGEPQLWHPTDTNKDNWNYWYTDSLNGSTARSYLSAVAYNNRMYILGGQTNASSGGTTTMEYADIRPNGTLGSWTSGTALPSVRHGHSAHIYNNVLYLIGGNSNGTLQSTVSYNRINTDGTMNSWVSAASFSTARATQGGSYTTIWGAYIYLAGGCTAVNGSGYCTTIASDTQIASINADGSISSWGGITNLENSRIGYTLVAWQNGLYRIGGCTAQDSSNGSCGSTLADVDYGVINPAGEVSTVDITVPSGSAPCSGGAPYSCDLPPPGDDAGEGGQMLSMTAVLNGHLYVVGGCVDYDCNGTTPAGDDYDVTGNVSYVAIDSNGRLTEPSTCGGTSYGSWCVDSTNKINNTGNNQTDGIAAGGVTVFNNRIYIVGGLTGNSTSSNIYYNSVNADGSLDGAWESIDMGSAGIAEDISYTFAYSRANPAQASSYPGNLYIFGGCGNNTGGAGCGGSDYETEVYKCWIEDTGEIEVTADSATYDCTTSGQLQIDSTPGYGGTDGLGIHSGTVYANYIYLIGGYSQSESDKDDVIYARFDNNNDVVAVSGGTWTESPNKLSVGRRRGWAFGYNGHIYSVGGYDDGGTGIIPFIEWSKMNVSDGSIDTFVTSSVTINQRWGLSMVVSNSYAYVVGGCDSGASPGGCSSFENSVQTFQLYNNDSGAVNDFTAQSDQTFSTATDRIGAASAIHDGYLYVAGGCTNIGCTSVTDNVQRAPLNASDGTVGSWSSTTDSTLPGQRAWGSLEVAGGTLYYVGGQDATGDEKSDVYYGTPVSGDVSTWSTASNNLPGDRTQHGSVVWNNRIYIVGGLNDSATVSNTVYVSPQLNSGGNITSSWTSTTAFNVARTGTAVTAYANNLYLFGGYDGANYLSDAQFAKISSDGTISSWTYTTSMPGVLRDARAFSANGYLYIVSGRTAATTCNPKVLITPISANTTIASGNNPTGIGEWYETNVRYTGDRYGAAVSYDDGKFYTMGGGCSSLLSSNRHYYSTVKSQPQVAIYSRMMDTDTDVFPTKWLMNGLDNDIGARWQVRYRSMNDTDGVPTDCGTADMTTWGQDTNFGDVTLGQSEDYFALNGSGVDINCARYFYFYVSIDASKTFGYPEDVNRGPTIADLSLFFTSDPSKRLRHGKTFTGGEQQPLDTPF